LKISSKINSVDCWKGAKMANKEQGKGKDKDKKKKKKQEKPKAAKK
jgi:hypothetical protein